jgi:hypothetical protein
MTFTITLISKEPPYSTIEQYKHAIEAVDDELNESDVLDMVFHSLEGTDDFYVQVDRI